MERSEGSNPRFFQPGYTPGIVKVGGYAALDGQGARRHVVGYVNIRNGGLTERSVLSFTNYLPLGKRFYVYQAAEYDLSGPAGQGHGGLTYFFANARAQASSRLEILGTFRRGRSIDVRTITQDQH